jgi:hypothetical protein
MNDLNSFQKEFDQPAAYEIIVSGTISPRIYADFQGISASSGYLEDGKVKTVLTGIFSDQAKLGELLNIIYEQQLSIISVRKLSD